MANNELQADDKMGWKQWKVHYDYNELVITSIFLKNLSHYLNCFLNIKEFLCVQKISPRAAFKKVFSAFE